MSDLIVNELEPKTPAEEVIPKQEITHVPKPVEEPKVTDAPKEEKTEEKPVELTDEEKAAAEAAKVEADKAKDLDTTVWGDTNSEVGNSTLTLLQNAGTTPEEAKALLFDAISSGDVTKIDKDALIEKVGKDNANLVLAGVKGYISENAERVTSVKTAVYEEAGSQENWNKMTDWANANNVDLSEYAPLIDRGGAAARFAVTEIKAKFNADSKNTALPAGQAPRQEPTNIATPSVVPITSAAEYATKYAKAHEKGDIAEMERLTQARRLGRKQTAQ